MKVIKKIIKGGVPVVFIDLPDSSSTTAIIFTKIGSRHESSDLAGISHLVEHCIFKGSRKYPTSQIISFSLEGLGASIDAGTSKEYTYFMVKSVKENFSKVLDILLDIYMNPLFESDEVEMEKKVVLEEIRMYKDDPTDEVSKLFVQSLWKKQSIGRDISGKITSVQNLSSSDLKNFCRNFYTKKNTQIVLSGNLGRTLKWEKLLAEKLKTLPTGRKLNVVTARNNLDVSSVVFKKDKVEQTHIILGTYGVSLNDENKYAAAVGNTILGQGMGSKLFATIRHKLGLAYYINSGNLSYTDSGSVYIRAGVDQKRFLKALVAIKDEIIKIISGSFSDEELFRAKQMLKSALVLELDGSDSMGLYLGIQELLVKKPVSIEQVKEQVDDVSKEEIVNVFGRIFSLPKLLAVISSSDIDIVSAKQIIAEIK